MPATTTSPAHLNPATQSLALDLRRSTLDHDGNGRMVGYSDIATALGLANWDAAARACEAESRRRVGSHRLTVAHSRRARTARRFGIEIEFNTPRSNDVYSTAASNQRRAVVADLVSKGIDARLESYNHDVQTWWKMTTDVTVTGGEIVSPIMNGTSESINEAREVVRSIKAVGGTTGRTVGMHVHHDVTDLTAAQMGTLVSNLRVAQEAMIAFVPQHRVDGSNYHGARRIVTHQWEALANAVADGSLLPVAIRRTREARMYGCPVDRSSFFNFNSVLTYGTVEFRGLGHTLNPIKIRTWIEVGQAVVEASRRGISLGTADLSPEELVAALRQVGLKAETGRRFIRFIAERIAQA